MLLEQFIKSVMLCCLLICANRCYSRVSANDTDSVNDCAIAAELIVRGELLNDDLSKHKGSASELVVHKGTLHASQVIAGKAESTQLPFCYVEELVDGDGPTTLPVGAPMIWFLARGYRSARTAQLCSTFKVQECQQCYFGPFRPLESLQDVNRALESTHLLLRSAPYETSSKGRIPIRLVMRNYSLTTTTIPINVSKGWLRMSNDVRLDVLSADGNLIASRVNNNGTLSQSILAPGVEMEVTFFLEEYFAVNAGQSYYVKFTRNVTSLSNQVVVIPQNGGRQVNISLFDPIVHLDGMTSVSTPASHEGKKVPVPI